MRSLLQEEPLGDLVITIFLFPVDSAVGHEIDRSNVFATAERTLFDVLFG